MQAALFQGEKHDAVHETTDLQLLPEQGESLKLKPAFAGAVNAPR